jgi:glutathione S-transferase
MSAGTAGEGARTIHLYGRPTSGNSYKVRLLLAFLGMPCSETHIALGTGGRNQVDQAYLALNPRGQIPTLVDGATVLWGSTGILVYLASRYDPSGTWLPRGEPATLGQVMQWLELAQNEINIGLFRARAIVRFGYTGDLAAARKEGDVALAVLETTLAKGGAWLAGNDAPTIADIACFPYVALAPEGGFDLMAYPFISRWISRMKKLPGYVPLPE